MTALIGLAQRRPDRRAVRLALGRDVGAPPTEAELDRSWEEAPAFDTPPSTGQTGGSACGRAAEMLRRMG
jgi:hypothetical protein